MLSQGGETYILGGKKIHYIFTYIEQTETTETVRCMKKKRKAKSYVFVLKCV